MTASDDQFLLQQMNNAREAWSELAGSHRETLTPQAMEEILANGIGCFHFINCADATWSRRVQAGTAKYDPDALRAIRCAYEEWLAPCHVVALALESLERYVEIGGGEQFRRCWRRARWRLWRD